MNMAAQASPPPAAIRLPRAETSLETMKKKIRFPTKNPNFLVSNRHLSVEPIGPRVRPDVEMLPHSTPTNAVQWWTVLSCGGLPSSGGSWLHVRRVCPAPRQRLTTCCAHVHSWNYSWLGPVEESNNRPEFYAFYLCVLCPAGNRGLVRAPDRFCCPITLNTVILEAPIHVATTPNCHLWRKRLDTLAFVRRRIFPPTIVTGRATLCTSCVIPPNLCATWAGLRHSKLIQVPQHHAGITS